jgi:hypothetical protein
MLPLPYLAAPSWGARRRDAGRPPSVAVVPCAADGAACARNIKGMRRHENPAPTGVLAAGRPRRGGGLAAGWRLALAAPWPFPLLAAGARRVSPPPVGRGRQPPTGAAGVGSGAPSAWRAAPAPPGARVPGTPLFVVASRRQMAAGHPPPGGAPQPPGAVDGGAGNLSPAPMRRGVVRCAAPQRAAPCAARCPPSSGRRAQRGAERRAEKRPPGACPLVGASGDKRMGSWGLARVRCGARVTGAAAPSNPCLPAAAVPRRRSAGLAYAHKRYGLTPPVLPLHEKTIRRTPSGVPPN